MTDVSEPASARTGSLGYHLALVPFQKEDHRDVVPHCARRMQRDRLGIVCEPGTSGVAHAIPRVRALLYEDRYETALAREHSGPPSQFPDRPRKNYGRGLWVQFRAEASGNNNAI